MRGVVVGGTQAKHPQTGASAFSLDLLDLDAPEAAVRRIRLSFLAHGFSVDPRRPHVAAVFEKRGPGGALVDLDAGAALRAIAPSEGRAFYGHGVHAAAGDVVYVVETTLATGAGVMTVRDADTFQLVEELPTFGDKPHDCVLVDGGKTLVVTNGGAPLGSQGAEHAPCVSYVDVATRKLLDRVTFPDAKINAGHIALAAAESASDFAVSSAPRDGVAEEPGAVGGLTLRTARAKPERMKKPDKVTRRMLGESLSVCIDAKRRTTACTNPAGDLLTFWDLDERKLRRAVDLEFPRGVALTLDGDAFVVTHGKHATLSLFDATSLEPLADASDYGTMRFSGSHVYVIPPR
jgi:hypothetical protein